MHRHCVQWGSPLRQTARASHSSRVVNGLPRIAGRHTARDYPDVSEVLKHFHIDLKLDLDFVTAIYRTLFFSVLDQELVGEHYDEAIGGMTDGVSSQPLKEAP